jgi:hypothetical protein
VLDFRDGTVPLVFLGVPHNNPRDKSEWYVGTTSNNYMESTYFKLAIRKRYQANPGEPFRTFGMEVRCLNSTYTRARIVCSGDYTKGG